MMFIFIHGLAPTHMINELEMVCERHDHNTRHADSLNVVVPKPNLECLNVVFVSQGLKYGILYQKTCRIAECASVDSFKHNCINAHILYNVIKIL